MTTVDYDSDGIELSTEEKTLGREGTLGLINEYNLLDDIKTAFWCRRC